jgi:1-acyl-sn-glycerol-3-phosphate acyltransferase
LGEANEGSHQDKTEKKGSQMEMWYKFTKCILKIYLAICIRKIHIIGNKNLKPGPKIIVANHPNLTDGFTLPFVFKEKLHFLIQSQTFSVPIFGPLLTKAGQIPVVRGRGREALNTALEKLSAGKVIVLFPEGKLNHGEKIRRGRSGAAVLALKSGAPVVPVGFYVPGKNTAMWRGRIHNRKSQARWQLRGDCTICIGKPWRVPPTTDSEINPKELRAITEKIMLQIVNLTEMAREDTNKARESHIHLKTETVI